MIFVGDKIGNLTVLMRAGYKHYKTGKKTLWLCSCACNHKTLKLPLVDSPKGIKSCGCLQLIANKQNAQKVKTHGESKKTVEYNTWLKIKTRCYNENHPDYANYGGRGLKVSKGWEHSYEQFLSDMGRRPSNEHSIERIDNDRGYNKGNCKWALPIEQQNNKRNIPKHLFKGKMLSAAQISRLVGISSSLIRQRLKYLTLEEAIK